MRTRPGMLLEKLQNFKFLYLNSEVITIFLIAIFVAVFRFLIFGNSLSPDNDDYVYWSQAMALKSMHLSPQTPFPDLQQWFMVHIKSGLVAKYLPTMGAYAVLATTPFGFTQYAFLTSLFTLFSIRFLLLEIGVNHRVRLVSTLLVGFNPLFFIHSSILLTYIPSFALGALTMALALRGIRLTSRRSIVAAGLALGTLATMRQLDAVCYILAIILLIVWRNDFRKATKIAPYFIGGLLCVAIAVVAYCAVAIGKIELPFNLISGRDTYWFGVKGQVPNEYFDFTIGKASNATLRTLFDLGVWGAVLPLTFIGLSFWWRKHNSGNRTTYAFLSMGFIWLFLYYPFWGPANVQRWFGGSVLGPFYFIPTLFFIFVACAMSIGHLALSSTLSKTLAVLAVVGMTIIPWLNSNSSLEQLASWSKAVQNYSLELQKFSGEQKVAVILPDNFELGNPFGEFSNTVGNPNVFYFPLSSSKAILLAESHGAQRFASVQTDFNAEGGQLGFLRLTPMKLVTAESFELKVTVPSVPETFIPRLVIDNGGVCRFYDLQSRGTVRFRLSPNVNLITSVAGQASVPRECVPHPKSLPLQIRLLETDKNGQVQDNVLQDTFYPNVSSGNQYRKLLVPGVSARAVPQGDFFQIIPSSRPLAQTKKASALSFSFQNPRTSLGYTNRLVVDRAGVCKFWDLDADAGKVSVALGAKPDNVMVIRGASSPPQVCLPHDPNLPLQIRLLKHNLKTNNDDATFFDDWFDYQTDKSSFQRVGKFPIARRSQERRLSVFFSYRSN